MQDWDRHPDGNIAVGPMLAYETAILPMLGLLRIRHARSEAEFEAGGVAVQLTMTPVQLRALSQDLLKMADRIDTQALGTAQ